MVDTTNINYGQYIVPKAEDCINLGVGQPRNDLLPLEDFNNALTEISKKTNYSLLQYGKIEGYDEFRNCLANFLSNQYKLDIKKDEIIITNGITGALSMLISLFKGKKTKIICEDPTYFLALNIFKDYGFNDIIKIKTEKDGINIEELNKIHIEPETTYLMYLIPFNQNPSSETISETKIKSLVDFLNLNPNVIIFSDEVYNLLNFDKTVGTPLYKYHKNIISMNSFSKIFAPALRLGWLSCSSEFIEKIKSCGQLDSSGCVNPISSAIMHEIILNGTLEKTISKWRDLLKTNFEILYQLLTEKLKDYIVEISKPSGGYFIWLKLENIFNTEELSKIMDNYKIKFHHGKKFSSQSDAFCCLRLSFSWYEKNDYSIFVDRFKQLLTDYQKQNIPKIHILGHNGKLGKLIISELLKSKSVKFYEGFGKDINLNMFDTNSKHIIIDVSSPEGTTNLINKLIEKNINYPLIIGTTGILPTKLIENYSTNNPVFICPNFSLGISQFKKIIDAIDKTLWNASVVEKHHKHKKDSPSGTALKITETYNKEDNYINSNDILSIREGEIIGEHELLLTSEYETIKISHSAKSRNLFAEGCVKLVEKIASINYNNGIYDYDSIML
jgi:2-aminoadipate transaminase